MIVALAAMLLAATDGGVLLAQMSVRERVTVRERAIIRVPRAPQDHQQPRWREERGPRCLPASALAGASISGEETVDLILRGGARFRARLERRCPAMDFYSGFYIRPGRDDQICADRDVIRSRAGGSCGIADFRALRPERRRRR